MDMFGIGSALACMVRTYSFSARRTGRTTLMVDNAKDGDRIVFADPREAERVSRLLKERGVKVECIVIDPNRPQDLFERGSVPGDGRSILDHSWVERYYEIGLERLEQDLNKFERGTSGYGEAHRKTLRRAIDLKRQGYF